MKQAPIVVREQFEVVREEFEAVLENENLAADCGQRAAVFPYLSVPGTVWEMLFSFPMRPISIIPNTKIVG
jgi:hypothetical protein